MDSFFPGGAMDSMKYNGQIVKAAIDVARRDYGGNVLVVCCTSAFCVLVAACSRHGNLNESLGML